MIFGDLGKITFNNLILLGFIMERIKTGVSGFDGLVEGGFPEGFNILITGAPGTGKTIFGLQYIYNGAMMNQNGLYVALDSTQELIENQAMQFGWDFDKLEKEDKISILNVPLNKKRVNLFDMLEEEVRDFKAKRLVFDSLASFALNIDQFAIPLAFSDGLIYPITKANLEAKKKDKRYRSEVMASFDLDPLGRTFYTGSSEKRITYLVIEELSKLGTTNFIITDEKQGGDQLTIDGVSEFVCDGLISLKSLAIGETLSRTMEIKKMRLTHMDGGVKSYEIGKKGIELLR